VKLYVASKSGNKNFALDPDNIIEVCRSGPDPLGDAQSYAQDYVRETLDAAWVHAVELTTMIGYRIQKEVVAFAPAKP